MLDEYLLNHCAPTLAGIKCSNLFSLSYKSPEGLRAEVACFNAAGRSKGLSARVLSCKNGRALVYVYREKLLRKTLSDSRVWALLKECGYEAANLENILNTLGERIASEGGFPHEIGIFLGYPYGDVKGFIEHTGNDYIFSGYWKVYENPESTRCLFASFDACKTCMQQSYKCGMSIAQLMVAV